MSNRINLDDPEYSPQIVVHNKNAKIVWIIIGIVAVVLIIAIIAFQSGSGGGGNKNNDPHANCKFQFKDREYFAGPMVDLYYNSEHPEWGFHAH